jgi:tRNA threonylcarbamoyladenosine biosynthesis protein TsaB
MAVIVSIETATPVCSVAVHRHGKLLAEETHHSEKSHSSLLPVLVTDVLTRAGLELHQVDAFAVSSGPGSYTGLRIGASIAKGFCYALNKPLIAVPTLEAMLHGVRNNYPEDAWFCPMLDARRMEVYCLLANRNEIIRPTAPLIVEPDSFEMYLEKPLYLFGDGAAKTKAVLTQPNLVWLEGIFPSAVPIGELAWEKYQREVFADVAYFEPVYLKEFEAKPAKKLV